VSKLKLSAQKDQLIASAKAATKEAGELSRSAMPPIREVRRLEISLGPADELSACALDHDGADPSESLVPEALEQDSYEACKQELLRQLNKQGPDDVE
jgi:hypothetical protein